MSKFETRFISISSTNGMLNAKLQKAIDTINKEQGRIVSTLHHQSDSGYEETRLIYEVPVIDLLPVAGPAASESLSETLLGSRETSS